MTTKPKLGIVIPSYNQGEYVEMAIESCLSAQGIDEVAVLDGGSTDDTCARIEKYRSHLKYYRSHRDGGQSAAIEEGIAALDCEYVSWLNSDDIFVGKSAGAIVNAAKARIVDVIYGNHQVIDEHSVVRSTHYHPAWCKPIVSRIGPYIAQPGTFFKKSKFLQIGGINRELHYVMDTDLWYRFMQNGSHFGTPRKLVDNGNRS